MCLSLFCYLVIEMGRKIMCRSVLQTVLNEEELKNVDCHIQELNKVLDELITYINSSHKSNQATLKASVLEVLGKIDFEDITCKMDTKNKISKTYYRPYMVNLNHCVKDLAHAVECMDENLLVGYTNQLNGYLVTWN